MNTERLQPHAQPAYGIAEAAAILLLPGSTVRAWSFGEHARVNGQRKLKFSPVIQAAHRKQLLLSFENLCELHLLGVIRKHHRVPLPKVRKAVKYMQDRLDNTRPLLSKDLLTNGVDLFVEIADQVLAVSMDGQQSLRDDFLQAMQRVEFDKRSGRVLRLFPFTTPPNGESESSRSVVVDPLTSFGRPIVAAAGVRTRVVHERFMAGDSMDEMAGDYGVSLATIEDAVRFEQRVA